MIIYNVTVKIDNDAQAEWLSWMKNTHIPDVMNTGLFVEHTFSRIVTLQQDETGQTYSIQYRCNDLSTLQQYQDIFAPKLQQEHSKKFEGKFVAFRTILEEV